MDENQNQELAQELQAEDQTVSRGLPIKKIISFAIGAVAMVVLLITFFVFILPRFSQKKNQDVTLVYWGIWEDSSAFEEVAQDFTRQNSNIKIKYEKQDIKSLGKYIDRLSTRIKNATGPDIYRYHNSWILEVKPLLLPMPEDVVKETALDSKFYPVVEQDLKVNGAYFGIPIHFDTLALFVNNQLFRTAGISSFPSTWDDLVSAARQMTVKDSEGKIITSGVALGSFDNIAHSSVIISLLLVQNGADLADLNGKGRQNAIDGLDFYTSFARGDAKVWDDSIENSKLAFAKGNLAMYFGYSWDIFELKALNPNIEFTVIPVPHLPQRESTIASYWVEGVSAKTRYPEAAFEFLKYLASKTTLEKLYSKQTKTRLFGELYPREDMADLVKSNTLIYPFLEQGKNAKSTIFSSDTHDNAMVDQLNSYLGDAIRSIIQNNSSPQSAVETLSQGVAQVLGRYENTTKR